MDAQEKKKDAGTPPDSSEAENKNQLPLPDLMRDFIFNIKEPTVVQGAIKEWDVLKWNLKDWSNSMNGTKLPFRVGKRRCALDPQWEATCRTEELTLDEFIESLENDTCTDEWKYFDYKYMNQWFKDNNVVMQSISWETLGFPEFHGEDSAMWIGSKGANTPCHYDSYSFNIVAQIYGKKMWIMFPPNQTNQLRPTRVPYEESSIYSKINFCCGNSDFSGIDDAYFVVLEPGDVLIVPNQWWHYVENLSTAISINTWIPLDSDDEKRLEECLVKHFVINTVKNLSLSQQKQILNPNESLQIHSEHTTDIEQLNFCVDIYKNKLCVKKETTDGRSKSIDSINLNNYNSIHKLNKVPMNDVIKVLQNKCKCSKNHTLPCEFKSSKLTVQDYINAFCHPDVISKVKETLLNKK